MTPQQASPLLRYTLLVDATTSGASGLLMVLGATAVQGALGLPAALNRGIGISLLPWAAFIFYLWRRGGTPRGGVSTVIGVNAAWVAASALLVVAGSVPLTAAGSAVVATQALAVALLAALQYAGLQRSTWRTA